MKKLNNKMNECVRSEVQIVSCNCGEVEPHFFVRVKVSFRTNLAAVMKRELSPFRVKVKSDEQASAEQQHFLISTTYLYV